MCFPYRALMNAAGAEAAQTITNYNNNAKQRRFRLPFIHIFMGYVGGGFNQLNVGSDIGTNLRMQHRALHSCRNQATPQTMSMGGRVVPFRIYSAFSVGRTQSPGSDP